ncbi:MAG: glycosyltransferase family 4 protein [Gelidibacter sp.]
MRIIFLARYLPAEGSTTHMYAAAKNLIDRGHEVYILSGGPGDDQSAIEIFEKTKIDGVQFINLPFPLFKKINVFTRSQQLASYIFVTPFTLFQLYKIKPDVIHAHYPVTTYLADLYRYLTGKKFIVTHHITGIPKHILNRKADYVIAISRELEEDLISSYKYDKNQVKLIFNGVRDRQSLLENNEISRLRETYDIPHETVLFGFVGSISYRKGLDIIVKAFSQCRHLKIHLIVLGNGEIDWLNKLINDNQVSKMVTLIPFRDPTEIYSMIDVLILPSRQEGFPLVPLEAMMMKKPVIRSNIQGASDQIINGINGYLFESENHLELARVIEKIALDPKLLIDLGENAYKHAVTNFSEDYMIDQMLDIYHMTI